MHMFVSLSHFISKGFIWRSESLVTKEKILVIKIGCKKSSKIFSQKIFLKKIFLPKIFLIKLICQIVLEKNIFANILSKLFMKKK